MRRYQGYLLSPWVARAAYWMCCWITTLRITSNYISVIQSLAQRAPTVLPVASAKLTATGLTAVKVIFSQQPKVDSKYHFGGRLVQQPDGHLFVTLGDRGSQRQAVQPLHSHIGKVVKIDRQGQAAAGNPFTADKTAKAEIWSYGHRNIQGAALDAQGRLWTHEHGPQGGDEINITAPGKNYRLAFDHLW